MTMILGIDPGADGAFALLDSYGELVDILDMPTRTVKINKKNRRRVHAEDVADAFDTLLFNSGHVEVVIEKVTARQGEAPTAAFAFGDAFGIIKGVAAGKGLAFDLVTPAVWKPAMAVTSDKATSLAEARRQWPSFHQRFFRLKKHDGRAEAALIARWYYERQCAVDEARDAARSLAVAA